MLNFCTAPGCTTRTLGQFCVAHEPAPAEPLVFPRGRPYRLKHRELSAMPPPGKTTAPDVVFLEGAS